MCPCFSLLFFANDSYYATQVRRARRPSIKKNNDPSTTGEQSGNHQSSCRKNQHSFFVFFLSARGGDSSRWSGVVLLRSLRAVRLRCLISRLKQQITQYCPITRWRNWDL